MSIWAEAKSGSNLAHPRGRGAPPLRENSAEDPDGVDPSDPQYPEGARIGGRSDAEANLPDIARYRSPVVACCGWVSVWVNNNTRWLCSCFATVFSAIWTDSLSAGTEMNLQLNVPTIATRAARCQNGLSSGMRSIVQHAPRTSSRLVINWSNWYSRGL